MIRAELLAVFESAREKKELDLSGKGIRDLPREIGRLSNLEELNLRGNELTSLPQQIGQLVNLRKLNLGENRLLTLPKQLGHLTSLQELRLVNNRLEGFPEQIWRLTKLTHVYLANNRLEILPEQIGHLVRLKWLTLYGNRLTQLPRSIEKLAELETLFLGFEGAGNPITELPVEIRNLTKLKLLDVSGCPELDLPPEIVAKTTSPRQILDYYFVDARTQSARPLNEAKVLVVGEAEVGKTSLIKQLVDEEFDPKEDPTHGIVTRPWDLVLNDRTVRLNVWDFGGQEIMHATHQFFLTKRSLYLLVLDSRQNERQCGIEYWLKLIHSYGGDSPVIVICNKCDHQLMELDWKGLQHKYSIRCYVKRVSCFNGTGLLEVESAIREAIADLQHVETIFPESWFQVKEELERFSGSFLPYAEYIKLCEENGITDDSEQRRLIGFLHDLGIVLHFSEHPILRDLSILNPKWVTAAVYCILTSKQVAAERGVLKFEQLETILRKVSGVGFEYPTDGQLFVIEMMRRFELLFEFAGEAGKKFLLPGLLPLEQPEEIDADWGDALGFRYQYDVLPVSVMSRLIVRMHRRIRDGLYWRKGVVLQSPQGDAQACIRADFEDAYIDIRVRGDGRRRFLQSIRDQFDSIHKSVARLNIKPQIHLPNSPETLWPFDRLKLLRDERIEIDRVEVQGKLRKVNVHEALEEFCHPRGLDIFISYAHQDRRWLDEFNEMLSPLVRNGRITIWSDLDIGSGSRWRDEIDRALRIAKVGLLLVSRHFLASKFIMEHELPYLLGCEDSTGVPIEFVLLGHCLWKETPLNDILAAHDTDKPLEKLRPPDRNKVMTEICKRLMSH